jgi:hypothetical protein
MGGGIAGRPHAIARGSDHFAVQSDDCADRHFARIGGGERLIERETHRFGEREVHPR